MALEHHKEVDCRLNWELLNHNEANVCKVSVSPYKNR